MNLLIKFPHFILGCGAQEQFQACADVAIGDGNVVMGEMTQTVEVPAGDVDEREWEEMAANDPCACQQIDSASGVKMSAITVLFVLMLALFSMNLNVFIY